MKEKRKTGKIISIPTEYNVGFPMNSLEEVKDFCVNLDIDTLRDADDKIRSRRIEFVSELWNIITGDVGSLSLVNYSGFNFKLFGFNFKFPFLVFTD